MINLAIINELIGLPPNASEHGYQIDHIIEFCHWFMGALFVGWSVYFIYVLLRFRKGRHPTADHEGVKNAISTHLEFSVVLIEAVLLLGVCRSALGQARERISSNERRNPGACDRSAV